MLNDNITYQINMAEAFALAFGKGQIPLKYQIPSESVSPIANYSGIGDISQDEIKDMSWLGTPIHFKFSLKGGLYNFYTDDGKIEQKEMQEFQMPLTTMCEFTRTKRITTTATAGGYGTVKELYGFDDWNVKVRGVCLYDPSHPQYADARSQRRAIQSWENLADAVQLVEDGNVFADLNIYSLVIKSIRLGSVVGKPKYLPFELNCISDEPLELIL